MAIRIVADVVVVGFGGAGGCAAIEACDCGATVALIEKQAEGSHCSNTRMSGGGFHSPDPSGCREALVEYARAMFSGENLPNIFEGEQPDFSQELAEAWATMSPQNESFMHSLDTNYRTFCGAKAAFADFPGAKEAGYLVVESTYTSGEVEAAHPSIGHGVSRISKEGGEAFFACILTGVRSRKGVNVHYNTRARRLLTNADGEVIGVQAETESGVVHFLGRRGVILTSGGYEYNKRMRKAFLDGPGAEGWAFYGATANTGDGIEMAMRLGAQLAKVGKIAGRIICAVPERRNGLKVGLSTNGVGQPNELVVDNYGERYASESQITKDPSRYIFYKEALRFDTLNLSYPRIPSWMIFDETLRATGPIVRVTTALYNNIDWGNDNLKALEKGWILEGPTLELLAQRIHNHPENCGRMETRKLLATVARFNDFCARGMDEDFGRQAASLGPISSPPFYAIPLYPGGPNTKGGLRTDARREVLDWEDHPIKRLYSAGEMSSAFQFVYQAGGNLGECIAFGRLAGRNAAGESDSKDLDVAN